MEGQGWGHGSLKFASPDQLCAFTDHKEWEIEEAEEKEEEAQRAFIEEMRSVEVDPGFNLGLNPEAMMPFSFQMILHKKRLCLTISRSVCGNIKY